MELENELNILKCRMNNDYSILTTVLEKDIKFFETSAKKNDNVVECFEELLQQIYNTRRKNPGSENLTESIVLKKKILQKHEISENSMCC